MLAVASLSRMPQRQCQNGFSGRILLFQFHLEGAEVSAMHDRLHYLRTGPCMAPSPAHELQSDAREIIRSMSAGIASAVTLPFLHSAPARTSISQASPCSLTLPPSAQVLNSGQKDPRGRRQHALVMVTFLLSSQPGWQGAKVPAARQREERQGGQGPQLHNLWGH